MPDLDKKSYWTQQMDAAYDFMQRVMEVKVEECLEPMVNLPDLAKELGVEMVFPQDKKFGEFTREYFLRTSLANKFFKAAETMLKRDWIMRIEDTYRPMARQKQGCNSGRVLKKVLETVLWELNGKMPDSEFLYRRLSVYTATVPIFANHTAGSTIDLTVLERKTRQEIAHDGYYPEFSVRTFMDSAFISDEARKNRQLTTEIMHEQGFNYYPYEFWHYSCGDPDYCAFRNKGETARYASVDLDRETGEVTAVDDLYTPFLTMERVEEFLHNYPKN